MTFTDIFVRRPVLALVVSALIVLLGLFALSKLPIRQYPMLQSSAITITTSYPGASAELIQGFVTQPIAQSVSSVEGVDYLTSSSVQGQSIVTVRMELNRDPTTALAQAMAKVNQVRYKLPEQAYDPVIELSSGESTAVAYIGFSGGDIGLPALTDFPVWLNRSFLRLRECPKYRFSAGRRWQCGCGWIRNALPDAA